MGDRVLVATTDPITFTTELIGWYAVQVNANDIACMGARPRWFLATVLLPEGAEPGLAKSIFSQILETCTALDVSLIGGHTEVTHKLQRPLVVGFMLGETSRERLVRTSDARPGDAIVLTKAIAIEGTAILSTMAVSHLRPKISKSILKKAERFLFEPGISVVAEALAAQDLADIHAMHDPTEGGLATGLQEIAESAQVGLEVDWEAIPFLQECKDICSQLELNPLGLLASGALIMTLPKNQANSLVEGLSLRNIQAHVIGKVLAQEKGVMLRTAGKVEPLPQFPRDELARYLEQLDQA
jgi:hydrogenase expression/formation protein HypE